MRVVALRSRRRRRIRLRGRELGVEPHGLDDLLAESDIVSLHLPLVASTRGLIDGRGSGHDEAGAILVNSARGGIVDEAALARALHAGRLAGAALDVFEEEPLAAGSAARRRAEPHPHAAHRRSHRRSRTSA